MSRHKSIRRGPSWWPLHSHGPGETVVFVAALTLLALVGDWWVLPLGILFIVLIEWLNKAVARWVARMTWKRIERSDDPIAEGASFDWASRASVRDCLAVRRWVTETNRREKAGEPPLRMEDLDPVVQDYVRAVAMPPREPEAWDR